MHKTKGYNFYREETYKQTICVHVWRNFVSYTTCTHFGKLLRRTLLAYSLRYFWNVLVRSIIGLPVLSWEHWTMHFLQNTNRSAQLGSTLLLSSVSILGVPCCLRSSRNRFINSARFLQDRQKLLKHLILIYGYTCTRNTPECADKLYSPNTWYSICLHSQCVIQVRQTDSVHVH